MNTAPMIFAIDIGGTKMELVVFDEDLSPQMSKRIATPTECYQSFLTAAESLVKGAEQQFQSPYPIGFGLPGLVNERGESLCSNLPCALGHNLAEDLAQKLGRKVVSENDCRAFALSEATGGAGAEYPSVLGAILGTGAAAGLVAGGALVKSAQGIAGEFGHMPISAAVAAKYALSLHPCGCGLLGCYETYISGPGLMRLARHFGAAATSPAECAELWQSGDGAATNAMECYLELAGACFATITMMCDPHIIVLGGGLSKIGALYSPLQQAVDANLFPGFSAPPIVPAKFGDASGVRGAAILAREMGRV